MKLRDNKGSITVFVLVGLLFMSAFLILSYGNNINKSKTAKEMFNIISGIYSYNDGDENAYMRAYTALRKQNAEEMTTSSENSSSLELTKTFYGPVSNYRIYGNSVQDTATYGTPSPTNPVEVESVGDLTKNIFNLEDREVVDFGDLSNTTQRSFTGKGIFLALSRNNYYYGSSKIENYNIDAENNIVEFTSTLEWYGIGFDFLVEPNTSYTLSVLEGTVSLTQYTEDGTHIKDSVGTNSITITTEDTTKWVVAILNVARGTKRYKVDI